MAAVNTVSMEELVAMKEDLQVELIRAEVKAEWKDMTDTLDYINEGLAWIEQTMEEMKMTMNKRVAGVGRIVDGRITYVSAQGSGFTRPVAPRTAPREVWVGEVLDVKHEVVGKDITLSQDDMGWAWIDAEIPPFMRR